MSDIEITIKRGGVVTEQINTDQYLLCCDTGEGQHVAGTGGTEFIGLAVLHVLAVGIEQIQLARDPFRRRSSEVGTTSPCYRTAT
jgi:hypothetical protein